MLEKWNSVVDFKRNFGALLTDLSEDFHCLCHDFLFAKLNTQFTGIKTGTKQFIK